MIAREVRFAQADRGSFARLVAYLADSQGKRERVGEIALTNLISNDLTSAVLEVQHTQSMNERAQNLTYHLVLAFHPDDRPSPEVIRLVEERACAALGFQDHQRVSVVHHDKDHLHVHLAISRVHPQSYRAHSPSYSKLELLKLTEQFERDYGLKPSPHRAEERLRSWARERCGEAMAEAQTWDSLLELAREHGLELRQRGAGLALVDDEGVHIPASRVHRSLSRGRLEGRLGPMPPLTAVVEAPARLRGGARDMEAVASRQSLVGWVQRQCGPALARAGSWAELHRVAQEHGLEVKLSGAGLSLVAREAGIGIRPSDVARELSKGRLEARLGAFEPASGAALPSRRQYAREPMQGPGTGDLYVRYQADREVRAAARDAAYQRAGVMREQDLARMRRVSERRWQLVRGAKTSLGRAIWARAARQHNRQMWEQLRRLDQKRRHELAAPHAARGWLEWLQAEALRGDIQALTALRSRAERRAQGRSVTGDERAAFVAGGEHVTPTGTVVYAGRGGVVLDNGEALQLKHTPNHDVAVLALRLAQERFGARLQITGDAAFRDALVKAAVSADLPVTFDDPGMESQRVALRPSEAQLKHVREQQRNRDRRDVRRRSAPRNAAAQGRRGVSEREGARAGRGANVAHGSAMGRRRTGPQSAGHVLHDMSGRDVAQRGSSQQLLPADGIRHIQRQGPAQARQGVRRSDAMGRGLRSQTGKGKRPVKLSAMAERNRATPLKPTRGTARTLVSTPHFEQIERIRAEAIQQAQRGRGKGRGR